MNPYDDFVSSRISSLTDDITSSPLGPAPPLYSTLVRIDQSEQPPLQQTDQSELFNPYADVGFSGHNDDVRVQPAVVHSESVSDDGNGDCFLSADRADQSEASNAHSLAVVTAQFETEVELTNPDLECSICFSQFNNAFRCPKVLQCGHTFCLECLARMNVKSSEPGAVQCPLCRARTSLPALGLPKLSTDPQVLSRLPDSMQRVYSVRFLRNKGRLQLKRPDAVSRTQSTRRSLDVGLPSPVTRGSGGGARGTVGGAFFRFIDRPACRVLLLVAVVMMIILLTAVIVSILTRNFSL